MTKKIPEIETIDLLNGVSGVLTPHDNDITAKLIVSPKLITRILIQRDSGHPIAVLSWGDISLDNKTLVNLGNIRNPRYMSEIKKDVDIAERYREILRLESKIEQLKAGMPLR